VLKHEIQSFLLSSAEMGGPPLPTFEQSDNVGRLVVLGTDLEKWVGAQYRLKEEREREMMKGSSSSGSCSDVAEQYYRQWGLSPVLSQGNTVWSGGSGYSKVNGRRETGGLALERASKLYLDEIRWSREDKGEMRVPVVVGGGEEDGGEEKKDGGGEFVPYRFRTSLRRMEKKRIERQKQFEEAIGHAVEDNLIF